jgi:hypothetical protein
VNEVHGEWQVIADLSVEFSLDDPTFRSPQLVAHRHMPQTQNLSRSRAHYFCETPSRASLDEMKLGLCFAILAMVGACSRIKVRSRHHPPSPARQVSQTRARIEVCSPRLASPQPRRDWFALFHSAILRQADPYPLKPRDLKGSGSGSGSAKGSTSLKGESGSKDEGSGMSLKGSGMSRRGRDLKGSEEGSESASLKGEVMKTMKGSSRGRDLKGSEEESGSASLKGEMTMKSTKGSGSGSERDRHRRGDRELFHRTSPDYIGPRRQLKGEEGEGGGSTSDSGKKGGEGGPGKKGKEGTMM